MLRTGHKFIVLAKDRQGRTGALGFSDQTTAEQTFEQLRNDPRTALLIMSEVKKEHTPKLLDRILGKTGVKSAKEDTAKGSDKQGQ